MAAHGYSPQKPDYTTVFMASGKGIQSGQIISDMHHVDISPALAKIMGLNLGDTDGKVIEAFIQSNEKKEVDNEFNKTRKKLGFIRLG